MKKTIVIIVLICSISCAYAQDYANADSLKKTLAVKADGRMLLSLSYFYLELNLDSSMKYAQQAYQLSLKDKSQSLEAWSYNMTGAILWRGGNTAKSLESLLKALKIFEALKDSLGLSTVYISLGALYNGQSDYPRAIDYLLKTLKIAPVKALPTDLVLLPGGDFQKGLALGIMGGIYVNLNKLDSALIFSQQSYEFYTKMQDKKYLPVTLNLLGYIHQRLGNTALALEYYRLGVKEASANGNLMQVSDICMTMVFLFKENKATDSAFYYAKKAFVVAQEVNSPYAIARASSFLKDFFRNKNMLDSAFTYQEIMTTAKDSVLNLEKIKQVQNLSFDEQLRQQEIAAQKIIAEEKRKKNLQLMGIAIFILVFFGVILLMSRKKVKSRTLEFMGLLALLLLFEFISLFIDPYIANWTHETPVFMLMILVCIAAILVPMHHKLTAWVKEKLAHKNIKQYQPVIAEVQPGSEAKQNNDGVKNDPY